MRTTLRIACLALVAITLFGCGSALQPLDAFVVETDPAIYEATRSVRPILMYREDAKPNGDDRRRRRKPVIASLASLIVLGDDLALTAAHCVADRPIEWAAPDQPGLPALVGWRTMPARVIERGEPDDVMTEWALLGLQGFREGPGYRDDGVPIQAVTDPVIGERCLLIGYPQKYLGRTWHRGIPHPMSPTDEDATWRPPAPLVFEGRVVGVGTTDRGHRISIDSRGEPLKGLSGGGAFVLRDGAWALVGTIAQEEQWWWKREIGVAPVPQSVRALVPSVSPAAGE